MNAFQASLFDEPEKSEEQMTASIPRMVERGDIWHLEEHRLICGDATDQQCINRLFGDDRFSLCFTSPPYSNQRTYKIGSFDWHSLMCDAFDQIITHGTHNCHILINLGLSHKNRQVDTYWWQWLQHCSSQGWPLFGWYVWDQGTGLHGEWGGRLAPSYEFVFHFNQRLNYPNKWINTTGKKGGSASGLRRDNVVEKINSPGKVGQPFKIPDSVVRINRECARGIHTANHPAVFPVAFPEFIMRTWSQPGDIVYEPFAGSGTSLIAGSNLKRRVFACEVEPTYCDLIIARWQQYTGQKATKAQEVAS
jgi:DNA modification methylase